MNAGVLTARQEALQRMLDSKIVLGIADGIERLPVAQQTYNALAQALSRSGTGISEIAAIVQADPGMSVRVLQLANSAFFGRVQRTTSIAQAVNVLGVEVLKSLALLATVSGALEHSVPKAFSLSRFQMYSIKVANLARRFVVNQALADEAFTAGIAHDIGKIVLALKGPSKFVKVLQHVAESGEQQHVVERKLFGTSHAEAGAWLLSKWHIPFPVVECVAFHHDPSAVVAGEGDYEVLAVVHAADALIGIISCKEPEDRLDIAFLQRTGYADEVPRWRKIVEDEFASAAA